MDLIFAPYNRMSCSIAAGGPPGRAPPLCPAILRAAVDVEIRARMSDAKGPDKVLDGAPEGQIFRVRRV